MSAAIGEAARAALLQRRERRPDRGRRAVVRRGTRPLRTVPVVVGGIAQRIPRARGPSSSPRPPRCRGSLALAIERDDILEEYVEKSDTFARTLVASGTFGFLPDVPSAYTQPLYAWFLAALYWPLERSWVVVGPRADRVAVATALLVLAIGRHLSSVRDRRHRGARHDAAPVPRLARRPRQPRDPRRAARGARSSCSRSSPTSAARRWLALATGRRHRARDPRPTRGSCCSRSSSRRMSRGGSGRGRARVGAALLVVVGAAAVVAPWVVRNDVVIGCPTITTDTRALWKANNPATYDVLARGGWIDDVPDLPGVPPWPERAAAISVAAAKAVDECAQARFYRDEVLRLLARRARARRRASPSRRSGCSGRRSSPSTPTTPGSRGRGPRAAHGRARLRASSLYALRALGRVPRAAPVRRRSPRSLLGLNTRDGDGVRRDGALPRAVGLRARAARRVRARARLGARCASAARRTASAAR